MHEIFIQNIVKIFIAIDPIALIPIFATLSTKIPKSKIFKLGIIIFLTSVFVLTFFAIFGNKFLDIIGISLSSFQIAGGIFLFFIAFEMLFEKRSKRKEKLVDKNINDEYLISFAIFPVAIPLIVGPSAITLSILISENLVISFVDIYTKILPIIIVLLFTVFIFFTSKFTALFLGRSATLILQKIFGIILGALAVEFIMNGFKLSI
ncbi:MAG: antibiotic resistance protein MarC [Rickettsiales bacterium]|nr:antibiotic resistance protein MarC [Rickettsiales bacterium]|tara:strand:+ start:134 stop:754 length:621 start_codon:yes stop_codon:yes gene_type:complete